MVDLFEKTVPKYIEEKLLHRPLSPLYSLIPIQYAFLFNCKTQKMTSFRTSKSFNFVATTFQTFSRNKTFSHHL